MREEDASAQEAVRSLARGSLYSVYQLFVNFTASEPNWEKEEMAVLGSGRFGGQVLRETHRSVNEPNP